MAAGGIYMVANISATVYLFKRKRTQPAPASAQNRNMNDPENLPAPAPTNGEQIEANRQVLADLLAQQQGRNAVHDPPPQYEEILPRPNIWRRLRLLCHCGCGRLEGHHDEDRR